MYKEVHFSKVAGCQAYSDQFYKQMNSFICIFDGFYLDFNNTAFSPLPPYKPHVLNQAPHQILNGGLMF